MTTEMGGGGYRLLVYMTIKRGRGAIIVKKTLQIVWLSIMKAQIYSKVTLRNRKVFFKIQQPTFHTN